MLEGTTTLTLCKQEQCITCRLLQRPRQLAALWSGCSTDRLRGTWQTSAQHHTARYPRLSLKGIVSLQAHIRRLEPDHVQAPSGYHDRLLQQLTIPVH